MSPVQSYLSRLLLVAVMLAIAGRDQRARAQDQEENEERTQASAREAHAVAFRAWVSNFIANRLGIQGIQSRDFLETLLLRRIKHLAADGQLTEAQLAKLKLAGRADIRRFVDRVDKVARKFELTYTDRDEMRRANLELQAAWSDVQAGFFVQNSLLYKALTRMLSPERAGEQATLVVEYGKGIADRSRTSMVRLDSEAELARSDIGQLIYTLACKQDFDRWVWRELKCGVERRDHLRMHLSHRLSELVGDCDLTWAQFKKLELAGTDDINRFLERLDEFERRFASILSLVNDFPVLEAESLKCSFSSDFGVDSCFSKSLASTLSEEQRAACEQRLGERNRVRYLTAIHQVAVSTARAVRMSEAERTKFEELLRKETRQPRRFGRLTQSEFQDFDSEVVLVQASRISETKLREALGEPCCDKLSRRLSRWSGVDPEVWLKSNGFILEEGLHAARPDRTEAETKMEKRQALSAGVLHDFYLSPSYSSVSGHDGCHRFRWGGRPRRMTRNGRNGLKRFAGKIFKSFKLSNSASGCKWLTKLSSITGFLLSSGLESGLATSSSCAWRAASARSRRTATLRQHRSRNSSLPVVVTSNGSWIASIVLPVQWKSPGAPSKTYVPPG